jgi:hypothetical protein
MGALGKGEAGEGGDRSNPSLSFFLSLHQASTFSFARNMHPVLVYLALLFCLLTVLAYRDPDTLYHPENWPSNCPTPYENYSYFFATAIPHPGGDVYYNGTPTSFTTQGIGNLDLPGITFGTGVGQVDLNAIAGFVDPLTATVYSYSSKSSAFWPDLNMRFQTAHLQDPTQSSLHLYSLYNHQNGIPAVVWERALSYYHVGLGATQCVYLGRIQTVSFLTANIGQELWYEFTTLTGKGLFEAGYNHAFWYDPVTQEKIINQHLGLQQGMRQMRTSAVILMSYNPSTQTIMDTASGGHTSQNLFKPLIRCADDWSGPNCDIPIMFEPDTRLPGNPIRCNNADIPLLLYQFPASGYGVQCAYNYTPYRSTSPDLGRIPAALSGTVSSCAPVALRPDLQAELWNTIFPYVASQQDFASFTDDGLGLCYNGQTRGVVDMLPISSVFEGATHFCTRQIVEGQVQDMPFPWLLFDPEVVSGVSSIKGAYCNARESRCICLHSYGGPQCQHDQYAYCASRVSAASVSEGKQPGTLVVPNPLNPSDAFLGDPIPRATALGYQFVELELGMASHHGAPATGLTEAGYSTFITNVWNPVIQDASDGAFGSGNAFEGGFHQFYYQPALTDEFPDPERFLAGGYLGATVDTQWEVARIICPVANQTKVSQCAGLPDSCKWDADEATNVTRQYDPVLTHIGCADGCGYPYFGHNCTDTCNPVCGAHFVCVNSGGGGWALDPVPLNVHCVCTSGYTDAVPSTTGTPEACVTCINEVGSDTPTCNGHGNCPLSGWTGPPLALTCNCDSGYIDQSCALPRTQIVTCGAQAISFNCTYQGKGTLSVTDYRYLCQATATLSTGTSPNEFYPASFYCPNVPSTVTCAQIKAACLVPTEDNGVTVTTDICPLPFQTFSGIGQSVTSFCDPPVSLQKLKFIIYNQHMFCYLHTRINPGVGLFPYVGKYRCVPSVLNTSTVVWGNCDLLLNYNEAVTWTPTVLGQRVMAACLG